MAVNDFNLSLKAVLNTQDIKNQLKAISQTQKIEIDAKGVEKVVKQVDKWQSGNNQIITQVSKIDKKTGELNTTLKTVNTSADKINQSFGDIVVKVSKFLLATTIISGFTSAIYGAVDAVVKLDSSLIELRKVSDLSGESLKQYTKDAFDLAEQMSTTATNVVDATTEFAKSGYSIAESMDLAEQALKFQTIADGAISASDSATLLIQTMKAYNLTVADSEKIIDSINEISNNYAVSSGDLSLAIGKVASTANLAGVDLDHLLGLMTGSNEIVQNASKVANGYKSILTNLVTKDLEKQFNSFGLTMRDQNGMLKDGYTILKELAGVYNSLGETWDGDTESMVSLNDEMNKLLEDIGGKYNINTLTAGLSNFDIAIQATESSINSAGSANEEYQTALDGIAKKMEALKGQFQELANNVINSQFIKSLLDAGTAILKFANSDIGQTIIKITLLTGSITAFLAVMGKLKVVLEATAMWSAWNAALSTFTLNTTTASRAVSAFNAVLNTLKINPIILGITGIATSVVVAQKAFEAWDNSFENLTLIQSEPYDVLVDNIEQAEKAFDESNKTTEEGATQAEYYANVLAELGNKSNKTAYEQTKLQTAVDTLNSLYPELNLAINNETGLLEGNTTAVLENANAYITLAKAKAYAQLAQEYEYNAAKARIREGDLEEQISAYQKKHGAYYVAAGGIYSTTAKQDLELSKIQNKAADWEKKAADLAARAQNLTLSVRGQRNGVAIPSSNPQPTSTPTGGGGGGGTAKEEDALKNLKEAYEEIISVMEHKLFLDEQAGASNEVLLQHYKDIQTEIHRQAQYYRSIGLGENHEYIMSLQEQWWKYQSEISDINKKIAEDAKKAREESLNKSISLYNAQLAALERYAQAQQDSIQKEIDALQEANNQREKSIELQNLEEALATARQQRIRIYEEGKGFVYREDMSAISQAQTALNEYNQQQAYEAELERLENRKQAWSDYVSNFKIQQDKLLNEQQLGTTEEAFIQQQRISNLQSFANSYLSIMQSLVDAQGELNDMDGSTAYGASSSSDRAESARKTNIQAQMSANSAAWHGASASEKKRLESENKKLGASIGATYTPSTGKWSYADGITKIPFNQWANVNENGDELIIPPQGNMQYLQKGTGVIPKTLTENLMEIGQLGLSGLKNFMGSGGSTDNSINIQSLTVRADNPTQLFNELKSLNNFKNLATQSAYE